MSWTEREKLQPVPVPWAAQLFTDQKLTSCNDTTQLQGVRKLSGKCVSCDLVQRDLSVNGQRYSIQDTDVSEISLILELRGCLVQCGVRSID